MGESTAANAMDALAVSTAANQSRDLLLYSVVDDRDKSTTLVRIVGSVHVSLDVAAAQARAIYWMFYKAQSGGGGAYRLEASVTADVSEENILHWRAVYQITAERESDYQDERVDIKVMRKFDSGQELRFNARSNNQFWTGVSVRMLFLGT